MRDLIYKTAKSILFTSLIFCFFYSSSTHSKSAQPFKINVIQGIQHAALDESRRGVYDELIAQGLEPGKDFVWIYSCAQGNVALSTQIAQKAISQEADAIVTLGTMATQSALSTTRDHPIPVIFASVTDPVAAKIVDSLDKPGGRATGVSNLTPSEPQFEMFLKLQPNLKRIGIIYSPGEANSLALNEDMKKAATKLGLELVFAPAPKTSDVATAAQKLLSNVDAYFVNNDGPALAAFANIVRIAGTLGKPVYVSDTDMVLSGGALAALGPNQYDLGRQTGKMLARVIRGESIQNMPVEFSKVRQVKINKSVADALKIVIPNELN